VSPPESLPLIALTGASESLSRAPDAYLVQRHHPDLLTLRCWPSWSSFARGGCSLFTNYIPPLLPLVSRPEFDSNVPVGVCPSPLAQHAARCSSDDPSLEFASLRRISVTGSDLRRSCLLRLCCVHRVSHPLDAFIPPVTLRPCSMPLPPLGFRLLQRFSFAGSGPDLSA
jgi:hypothetical protein